MIIKSASFTGHRPNHFSFGFNENHKDCIKLKSIIKSEIIKLIERGYTIFNSGMALGVDIFVAEIILELRLQKEKIKLHCILPYEEQSNNWSSSYRERYFNILSEADEVVYISKAYTKTCLFDRNRYLVNHCDILIAVFNGEKKSGTAMTINYAMKLNKPIIEINANTFEVTTANIIL